MKKYNNILVYDLETNGFFSKEGKKRKDDSQLSLF